VSKTQGKITRNLPKIKYPYLKRKNPFFSYFWNFFRKSAIIFFEYCCLSLFGYLKEGG